MEIVKTIWCRMAHKRWIMGTYHPKFQWVCHKCKRRWIPKKRRSLGIDLWIKVIRLKFTIIKKQIWGQ